MGKNMFFRGWGGGGFDAQRGNSPMGSWDCGRLIQPMKMEVHLCAKHIFCSNVLAANIYMTLLYKIYVKCLNSILFIRYLQSFNVLDEHFKNACSAKHDI